MAEPGPRVPSMTPCTDDEEADTLLRPRPSEAEESMLLTSPCGDGDVCCEDSFAPCNTWEILAADAGGLVRLDLSSKIAPRSAI